MTKKWNRLFYPSAKSRRELKIKTLGSFFEVHLLITFTKPRLIQKHSVWRFSDENDFQRKFCRFLFPNVFLFHVEKWNVGDHLKRVFPKFKAEQGHPGEVKGRSKFCQKPKFFRKSWIFDRELFFVYLRRWFGDKKMKGHYFFLFWGMYRPEKVDNKREMLL